MMEVLTPTNTTTLAEVSRLAETFGLRAGEYDETGSFVSENYHDLKAQHLFAALVPTELGGGGMLYSKMCNVIREIAHHCGSTALAFSMHQHLVAAAVWKYIHKGESEAMLRRVAGEQIVLVSTGARDWLGSNGEMTRTEGGYILSGRKHFASQSAVGDIAVTSAPYEHPEEGWKVLHFPVPFNAEGVTVLDDWNVMGMRATGSQTIVFDNVFVPDAVIGLERSRDAFHPAWNLVLTVAMPLIMSAYVGIAERAVEIAIAKGRKYKRNQKHMTYIIGKLNNRLISAQAQWKAMYERTNNFDFRLDRDNTVHMLSLKTNVADACIETVREAMEAIGGQSFYKMNELERLFRDIQAGQFHPLPKWEQYAFTGEKLLSE